MDRIELNLMQAMEQANQLDMLAVSMEQLAKRELQGTMHCLSSCWRGSSASAYLQKGKRLETNIESIAREMKRAANSLRMSAKRIYDSEMRAEQIAQTRTYGGGSSGGGR